MTEIEEIARLRELANCPGDPMREPRRSHVARYHCALAKAWETGQLVDAAQLAAMTAERDEWKCAATKNHPNPVDHRYWEGRYRDEKAENERMTVDRDEALKQHPQLLATIRCMEIAQGVIEAERDALVGAAYEAAALRVSLYFREQGLPLAQRSAGGHLGIADAIRALATPDHHAAIEAVKAKARAEGRNELLMEQTEFGKRARAALRDAAAEKEAGK